MFHKLQQYFTGTFRILDNILANTLLKMTPSSQSKMAAELILMNRKKDRTLLFVIIGYVAFVLFAMVTGEIATNFTIVKAFVSILAVVYLFYIFWWFIIPAEFISLMLGGNAIADIFEGFFGNYAITISDSFYYYFEAMSFFAVVLRFITALIYFIRYSATYTTTFYKLIPFLIFSIFILALAALKTYFILSIGNISFTMWILLQSISIMLFGALHGAFSVFQNAQEDLGLLNRLFALNHISLLFVLFGLAVALSFYIFDSVATQDLSFTLEPSLFLGINALIYSITFFLMIKYFYESWGVVRFANNLALNILSVIVFAEMIALFGYLVITPISGDYATDFILKMTLLPLFAIFALLYRNSISFGKFSIAAAYIVFIIIPIFSPMIAEIMQVIPGMYAPIVKELDWLLHPSWWMVFVTVVISVIIIGAANIVGIVLLLAYLLLQILLSILSATSGDLWNIFLLFLQGLLSFIVFYVVAIVVAAILIKIIEYLKKRNLLINLLVLFVVATLSFFVALTYVQVDKVTLHKSTNMLVGVSSIKKKIDKQLNPNKAKFIEALASLVQYNTKEYEDDMRKIRKNYLTISKSMQEKMFEMAKKDLKTQEKKEIQRVCISPKYIREGIQKWHRMSDQIGPVEYSENDMDEITALCSEQVKIKTDIAIEEMKSKIYKDLNTTLKDLKGTLEREEYRAKRDHWYLTLAYPYKTKLAIELIEAKIFTPNKEYEKRVANMHEQVKKASPKYYKIYFSDKLENKKDLEELKKVYKKYQKSGL